MILIPFFWNEMFMEVMMMVHGDDILDLDDWHRSTLAFIFDF
jgi:hypothetical protein